MAVKLDLRCKTCKVIARETPPKQSASKSQMYRLVEEYLRGKLSANTIAQKYPEIGHKNNILNHAKNHQKLNFKEIGQPGVGASETEELREEVVALKKRLFSMEQTKSDISELTEWLMTEMRAGRIKGSLGPLVNLVGKAAQISEKEIDQGISMASLMARYASGEAKQLDSGKIEPTESGTSDETQS